MKPTKQKSITQYFNRLETEYQHGSEKKQQLHAQAKDVKQQDNQKNQTAIEKDSLRKIDVEISGSQSEQAADQRNKTKCEKKQQSKTNVQFYLNKRASQPNGDLIENIHKKWWNDYEKLQQHHGFIQWIFPNAFQSRFNRMAFPLSCEQAKEFQENIEIAKRYQTSYMMILEFYGMKLKCKKTGEIARSRHPLHNNNKVKVSGTKPFFQERFCKTLLTSFHNHMRITRILSSLVMCGFGRYAKQLSIFLNRQINEGALRDLKKYGVYERQWRQYSQYVEKQNQKNILLKEYEKHGKQ